MSKRRSVGKNPARAFAKAFPLQGCGRNIILWCLGLRTTKRIKYTVVKGLLTMAGLSQCLEDYTTEPTYGEQARACSRIAEKWNPKNEGTRRRLSLLRLAFLRGQDSFHNFYVDVVLEEVSVGKYGNYCEHPEALIPPPFFSRSRSGSGSRARAAQRRGQPLSTPLGARTPTFLHPE